MALSRGKRAGTVPFLPMPVHYAWLVVFAAAGMNMVTSGIRLSFGVFLDPMVETYGWDRGAVTFAYAIGFFASAVGAITSGWAEERFGMRPVAVVGTIAFSLGMVLTGFATQVWHLYLFYGVIGGLGMSVFLTPLITVTTRWFRKNMGAAVGLVMVGQGAGPIAAAPVFRYFATVAGWRETFIVSGIAAGVVMLLLTLAVRDRPEAVGALPYGATSSDQPAPRRVARGETAAFLRRVQWTRPFWLLVSVHFWGCFGHAVILVHGVSMATSQHVPGIVAAGILSVISGVSIGSRFITPILADRIGGKRAMVLFIFIQATSTLLLLWSHEVWQFYLFGALFGIGFGGEMTAFPIINRQYYGDAPVGTVFGWQMFGAAMGMALGGWLGGTVFEATGAYTWAIWMSVLASYLAVASALALPTTRRRLVTDYDVPAARVAPAVHLD